MINVSIDTPQQIVDRWLPYRVQGYWENGQLPRLMRAFAVATAREGMARGMQPDDIQQMMAEAIELLGELQLALNPNAIDDRNSRDYHHIWSHVPDNHIHRYRINVWHIIARDSLDSVVARYLARSWLHNDQVDYILIDALTYSEWQAYTLAVDPSMKLFGRAKKIKMTTTECQKAKLWDMLRYSYQALAGPALSPSKVRDELLTAEKEGVVWPNTLWPVLQSKIERHPGVWITQGVS